MSGFDDVVVEKINAGYSPIGRRAGGFFNEPFQASGLVEFSHAILFGVSHIGKE